jgi:hypothetical protein
MASSEDDGKCRRTWVRERRSSHTCDPITTQGGANRWNSTGVAIKSEPIGPPELTLQSPSSPPLKRRRSEEPDALGEKRQRVASISAADEDMGILFAQAAAVAAQQIEDATSGTSRTDLGGDQGVHDDPARPSDDAMGEPYLLARVLSLPMLESLVS